MNVEFEQFTHEPMIHHKAHPDFPELHPDNWAGGQ